MRISTVVTVAAVSFFATTALAVEGVGQVMAVIDLAKATGQAGERTLAIGSKVFVGDLVTTDAAGRAQLLFADGTRMIVGSDSSLVIDEFRFGGSATEDASENRFVVHALAGRFRFISGDSGDRGFSIRTPSARISVRGTAFDFTVTPEGETKMLLLEGEATLCSEVGEDGEGGDCATVATPCALLQTDAGEDVEEIEAGPRRLRETREHFPHLESQSNLLEDFRIAGHGCIIGGLAASSLAGLEILVPVAVGAVIICVVLCFTPGGSTPSTNSTN